jgi:hypothetical protein
MSEQSDRTWVNIRCWPCHRRFGEAPLLAVAERKAGAWEVAVALRAGRRGDEEQGILTPERRWLDPRHAQAESRLLVWGGNVMLYPVPEGAAHLACRRCQARPRVARAQLVELAEQALADGCRDVFI